MNKLSKLWGQALVACPKIQTCYFMCQFAEKGGSCALEYERGTCPRLNEEFNSVAPS